MTRIRARCVALLLAVASAGCGNILDSSPEGSKSILGGEAMRLQLAQRTVTEGTALPLTVTLSNTGDSTILFEGNTCPFNVFEVEDAAGERIDPRIELILCAAYTQTVKLAPGESFTWTTQWTAARYGPSRVVRPPGPQTVRIRARYWLAGKQLVASDWQQVTVKQAP